MKKFLLAALICLVAISCNRFKSVEAPIEGAQNLVTFTVQDSELLGIKNAKTGEILVDAFFKSVKCKNNHLIAEIGYEMMDETEESILPQWDLLNLDGESIYPCGTMDSIQVHHNYFLLFLEGKIIYFSGENHPSYGPCDEIRVTHGHIFCRDGKIWSNEILFDEWENIIVISQPGGEYVYCGKKPNKTYWEIMNEKSDFIKKISPKKLKELEKRQLKDSGWGKDSIRGFSIRRLKDI